MASSATNQTTIASTEIHYLDSMPFDNDLLDELATGILDRPKKRPKTATSFAARQLRDNHMVPGPNDFDAIAAVLYKKALVMPSLADLTISEPSPVVKRKRSDECTQGPIR